MKKRKRKKRKRKAREEKAAPLQEGGARYCTDSIHTETWAYAHDSMGRMIRKSSRLVRHYYPAGSGHV